LSAAPPGTVLVSKYLDDENEFVTLSTDAELIDALYHASLLKKSSFKLFISLLQPLDTPPATINTNNTNDLKIVSNVSHIGVACDNCKQEPLMGVRYKCNVCRNFDLCSNCEATGCHDDHHPLIKYKYPQNSARSTRSSHSNPPSADWIKDLSVEDGSHWTAGSRIKKIWRLKNTGHCPWPPGCTFIRFVGGALLPVIPPGAILANTILPKDTSKQDDDQLHSPSSPSPTDYLIPIDKTVKAGSVTDLAVEMLLPIRHGHYTGYYNLVNGNTGKQFGPRFWVDIFVDDPQDCKEKSKCSVESASSQATAM